MRDCTKRAITKYIKTTQQKNKIWFWNVVKPYCRHCGYDKCIRALHFHHIRPEMKNGDKDTLTTWLRTCGRKTLLKRIQETEFIILCSNCHAEVHHKLWDVGEGNSDSVLFIGM